MLPLFKRVWFYGYYITWYVPTIVNDRVNQAKTVNSNDVIWRWHLQPLIRFKLCRMDGRVLKHDWGKKNHAQTFEQQLPGRLWLHHRKCTVITVGLFEIRLDSPGDVTGHMSSCVTHCGMLASSNSGYLGKKNASALWGDLLNINHPSTSKARLVLQAKDARCEINTLSPLTFRVYIMFQQQANRTDKWQSRSMSVSW